MMKQIFITFLMFFFIFGYSQICYTYDAAGNRIKRQVCALPLTNQENNELQQLLELQSIDLRTSSDESNDLTELIVYPNPTSGSFRLINQEALSGSLMLVISFTGKLVESMKISESDIDLTHLPSGSYYLILMNYKSRSTAKLLITK